MPDSTTKGLTSPDDIDYLPYEGDGLEPPMAKPLFTCGTCGIRTSLPWRLRHPHRRKRNRAPRLELA